MQSHPDQSRIKPPPTSDDRKHITIMSKVTHEYETFSSFLSRIGALCLWSIGRESGLKNVKALESWWLKSGQLIITQALDDDKAWTYFLITDKGKNLRPFA